LLFVNFSSFKLDFENNAKFDAVLSKRAHFGEVKIFSKHAPKLTYLAHIICRHLNIMHWSMNYCQCSFMCLIFVLNCITGSDENYTSHWLSTEETCTHYFRYAVWEMV